MVIVINLHVHLFLIELSTQESRDVPATSELENISLPESDCVESAASDDKSCAQHGTDINSETGMGSALDSGPSKF